MIVDIKKKIGGALMGTALGAALIGGGTFALFTSSATNEGNAAETGTLTIADITGGNGSAAFNVTNMAPGDSGTGTVTIQNTGSLDAWVAIDSATETGDLAPALNVTTDSTPVIIKSGQTASFTVDYELPIGTGNEFQGKTATLDVNFKAVQSKNNGDANDNGVADSGEAPTSWNEDASIN
jgi:spore coat-associated protein N